MIVNSVAGALAPDIPNLLELVANSANVFATVLVANKPWLIEGVEVVITGAKYHFGEYDNVNNRAKLLDSNGQEVRGDAIDISGGRTWDDAVARDTLDFTIQDKNKYNVPILLLQKSVLENKQLQVLNALDADITDKLQFIGEKKDDTNVDWNGYYIDTPLFDNETSDIKVQIGD